MANIQKKVKAPDGSILTLSVPENATNDQIKAFAKQEWDKRNAPPVATAPVKPDYSNLDPLELTLTSISNIPKSGLQFGKDITAFIHSPVQTAKGLYSLGKGLIELAIPGEQPDEATARAVGKFIVDRYYGWDNIKNTLATDPVGIVSDVAGLFTGGAALGAKVGGKAGQLASKVGTVAKAIDPATLAARGVGKVLNPRTNPGLKTLMKAGVKPTIGQILGGPLGKMEEKLTSVPVVGDVIARARQRAAGDLTRAAFNRALNPIGKSADKLPVNRQGLAQVSDALSSAYNKLLDNVSFKIDNQFMDNITTVIDNASPVLTKEELSKLNNIVSSKVIGRLVDEADAVTGATLKAVQSELRDLSSTFKKRGGPGEVEIGKVLSSVHDAVNQSLIRHNPGQAKTLKAIDTGYANYVRLRKAFSMAGTKSEGLTPAALDAAVRNIDQSVGKGDAARGRALMQDLSESGVEILGPKVPDSGTFGRAAAAGIPAWLAAGGAIEPTTLMAGIAGASPYLPGSQRVIADLMTRRTPSARKIGTHLQTQGPMISRGLYQSGRLGERIEDPYLLRTAPRRNR